MHSVNLLCRMCIVSIQLPVLLVVFPFPLFFHSFTWFNCSLFLHACLLSLLKLSTSWQISLSIFVLRSSVHTHTWNKLIVALFLYLLRFCSAYKSFHFWLKWKFARIWYTHKSRLNLCVLKLEQRANWMIERNKNVLTKRVLLALLRLHTHNKVYQIVCVCVCVRVFCTFHSCDFCLCAKSLSQVKRCQSWGNAKAQERSQQLIRWELCVCVC